MVSRVGSCSRAAVAAFAVFAAMPAAAQTLYTSRATFNAATVTTTQNFNNGPTASTVTSRSYGALTFSCTTGSYCPGFFGARSQGNGGSGSVFFGLPDTSTFSFTSPITAFGIDVLDVGTIRGSDFSVIINGTSYLLQDDYTSGAAFFFGYTGAPITSISFTGTAFGDGVDFDDAAYGSLRVAAAVPEPSTWAMMLLGFGAIGFSIRRRRDEIRTRQSGLSSPTLAGRF